MAAPRVLGRSTHSSSDPQEIPPQPAVEGTGTTLTPIGDSITVPSGRVALIVPVVEIQFAPDDVNGQFGVNLRWGDESSNNLILDPISATVAGTVMLSDGWHRIAQDAAYGSTTIVVFGRPTEVSLIVTSQGADNAHVPGSMVRNASLFAVAFS